MRFEDRNMIEFSVKPQIHSCDSFEGFVKEFGISGDDLIFTEQIIYDTFIKGMKLPCAVICRDAYGQGEPTDQMIDGVAAEARQKAFKRVVAVGGGSVIDIAKVLTLRDAYPCAKAFLRTIPIVKEKELIIIPTTCGTGSEMTNISIAYLAGKSTKLGLVDESLYADFAVLIPELAMELPYKFFVFSAIDALAHAMESYVSKKATGITEILSLRAVEMILSGFGRVIQNGEEYRKEIIGDFVRASNMAGIAFSNAGVGPVHALAYPLGGAYHVPHGEANYQFLVAVFNSYLKEKPDGRLKELSRIISKELAGAGISAGGEDNFIQLEKFLGKILSLKPLREYGMKESEIESFTQNVVDYQQRLLANSYIPYTYEIIRDIYHRRY
jgi:4-hydroxybutyrate dehydrogenase